MYKTRYIKVITIHNSLLFSLFSFAEGQGGGKNSNSLSRSNHHVGRNMQTLNLPPAPAPASSTQFICLSKFVHKTQKPAGKNHIPSRHSIPLNFLTSTSSTGDKIRLLQRLTLSLPPLFPTTSTRRCAAARTCLLSRPAIKRTYFFTFVRYRFYRLRWCLFRGGSGGVAGGGWGWRGEDTVFDGGGDVLLLLLDICRGFFFVFEVCCFALCTLFLGGE